MKSFSKTVFSKTALRLIAFTAIVGAIDWAIISLNANSSNSQTTLISQSSGSVISPQQKTSKTDFLSGAVVHLSANKIVLKQSEQGNVVLQLSPTTNVWNNLWVKAIPIQVGDRIDANVKGHSNGFLEVTQMYVNLVNLEGNISKVEKKAGVPQLSLQSGSKALPVVKVDPHTEILQQGKTTRFGNLPVEFQKDQLVRIMGRQLKDGSVIATRLIFVTQ